jgi:orotate phosphoribosyltransferase
MNLFQLGVFKLHSGEDSQFKIECGALTDDDLNCIAYLLSLRVPPFGSVLGIADGGLRLAQAMSKYTTEGSLLIVDDVYTTGNSINSFLAAQGCEAYGAVIFARTPTPRWITPLFSLFPELIYSLQK